MCMINLIIIYDMANIFTVKNYKSLRKLRVGVNRYTGVNWSTTTILKIEVYLGASMRYKSILVPA